MLLALWQPQLLHSNQHTPRRSKLLYCVAEGICICTILVASYVDKTKLDNLLQLTLLNSSTATQFSQVANM